MTSNQDQDVRYTVFVRVPFPRADFEDPPIVSWNGMKDRDLWKVLSSTPKGAEIDWDGLTRKFDVALPFLLQQAAWLYARQLSQVREQLRRAKPSTGTSPTPTSVSGSATATATGGHAMRRGGSGGGSRGPSSLSVRPRGSLELRNNEGSVPTTPIQGRMPYSRTASTNTITLVPRSSSIMQSTIGASPRQHRRSVDADTRESRIPAQEAPPPRSPSAIESSSSSASSSSADEPSTSHGHAFSHRPRFPSTSKSKIPLGALSSADEDEDDDTPAFLPFSPPADRTKPPQPARAIGNPSKSKSKDPLRPAAAAAAAPNRSPAPLLSTSASSASTSLNQASSSAPSVSSASAARPRNILSSPSNNAALATLSPRQRRIAQAGSESAGTPSMGSSFSDLDDASVTQSALEEALAREIKAGKGSIGVVGRMGGLWRQGMGGGGGGAQGGSSSRAV